MSAPDRRAMLDRDHPDLSVRRQCVMLGVARSGVYRQPRPANDNDLEAMRRIDALFTARPFFGARRIAGTLSEDGFPIDRKRLRRLMRLMGVEALGPKPRMTKPAPGAQGLSLPAVRPDDRAAEPGLGGRHHLRSDRARLSLSRGDHRLGEPGGSLLAAVEYDGRLILRGGAGGGAGEVRQAGDFNTDQGSQFTGVEFCGALIEAGVRISMDGRGRWMDNVFIERLWRSLKYEDVYLKGYADGREAKAGISDWITFYNERRLHQALGYRAPMAVWREGATPRPYGHVDNASALTTCPQAHQKQQHIETLAA